MRKLRALAILKGKKGLAIEISLLTMAITIALGILIMTVSMLMYNNDQSDVVRFNDRVALDKAGELVVIDMADGVIDPNADLGGYKAESAEDGDHYVVTVKNAADEIKLVIQLKKTDNSVVAWRYA